MSNKKEARAEKQAAETDTRKQQINDSTERMGEGKTTAKV